MRSTLSRPATQLPFRAGDPRSCASLTVVPLFPAAPPALEYIGLDEAVAGGRRVSEIGSDGVVGWLAVESTLSSHVLLYEGEELVDAKQDRIVRQSTLVAAGSAMKVPVTCVERGRWSHGTACFAPTPRAAYPSLRRAQRDSQSAAWADIADKQARLSARSDTGAAGALYATRRAALDAVVRALPRLDGQSGVIVGIGGRLVCLDYVSRSDVFAGIYLKLLRGYALDAIDASLQQVVTRPLSRSAVGRFLGELELAQRVPRPVGGLGEEAELDGYAVGRELSYEGEVVALSAFPAR